MLRGLYVIHARNVFHIFFFRIVCRSSLQILQNERIFPLHPWSLNCSCHLSKILLLKWTQYLSLTCTYFYLPIQSYKSTRNVSKHKWSGQKFVRCCHGGPMQNYSASVECMHFSTVNHKESMFRSLSVFQLWYHDNYWRNWWYWSFQST